MFIFIGERNILQTSATRIEKYFAGNYKGKMNFLSSRCRVMIYFFLRDIDTSLSGLCSGKVFIILMSGLKIRGFVSTGVQMSWDWPTLSTTKIVAVRTTSPIRDLVLD